MSKRTGSPKVTIGICVTGTNGEEGVRYIEVGGIPKYPHQIENTWDEVYTNDKHDEKLFDKLSDILIKALTDAGYKAKKN